MQRLIPCNFSPAARAQGQSVSGRRDAAPRGMACRQISRRPTGWDSVCSMLTAGHCDGSASEQSEQSKHNSLLPSPDRQVFCMRDSLSSRPWKLDLWLHAVLEWGGKQRLRFEDVLMRLAVPNLLLEADGTRRSAWEVVERSSVSP